MRDGFQGPTTGDQAETYGDYLAIVGHPAFRIGFLDAQHGRDFDHDRILQRIDAETPLRALERIGWRREADAPSLFGGAADPARRQVKVELAQYRYEEGRLLVVQERLRCKAWGHPDYPPKAVQDFIWNRAKANAKENGPT